MKAGEAMLSARLHGILRNTACVLISFAILLSVTVPSVSAEPEPPGVSASAAILIEAESGTVVFEKNADEMRPMASTTKIMTGILALEAEDPQTLVTVSPDAVGVEGSSIYLCRDEQLTMEELVYAVMLESANDAAAAVAIHVAGSIDAFAELMNRKAESLCMTRTHFCNPHGLDAADHYTTARDLATLARYALENEEFRAVVSAKRRVIPLRGNDGARLLLNHNRLLRSYAGAIGVKTGFTKKSGRCLVSAAERDGIRLIAVTLNAPDDWRDHAAMLDYGFSRFRRVTLAQAYSISASVPVVGGVTDAVTVSNPDAISVTLPVGVKEPEPVLELRRFYYAPVIAGETLGRAVWYLDGEEIGSVPLVAEEGAEERIPEKKNIFRRFFDWLGGLFRK